MEDKTKLTLWMDKSVIRQMKVAATLSDVSVSQMLTKIFLDQQTQSTDRKSA